MSEWTQVGNNIQGESSYDYSGKALSLSADGSIVAIGAYGHDKSGAYDSGYVRIFQNDSGTWTQLGNNIEGNHLMIIRILSKPLC